MCVRKFKTFNDNNIYEIIMIIQYIPIGKYVIHKLMYNKTHKTHLLGFYIRQYKRLFESIILLTIRIVGINEVFYDQIPTKYYSSNVV